METTLDLLNSAISVMKAIQSSPLKSQQLSKDHKDYIDRFLSRCFSKDGVEAMKRDGITQELVEAVRDMGTIGFVKMNAPVGTNDYHIVRTEDIEKIYRLKRELNLIGRSTSEVDPNQVPAEDKDLVKTAAHAVKIHQAIIDFAKDHPQDQGAVDLAVGAKATLNTYGSPENDAVGGIKAEEWVRVQAIGYLSYMRALGIKIPQASV